MRKFVGSGIVALAETVRRYRIVNVVGWAIQLIGTVVWVYGYFATGHPSLIDWRHITPWWVAEWMPNIEAEIGMGLVFVGMVLFYWPFRR